MKSRTRHQQAKTGHSGRPSSGFAMIELLLVVGLVLTVSAIALKSIASQRSTSQRFENELSTIQTEQAADWTLSELDGERVWVRGI